MKVEAFIVLILELLIYKYKIKVNFENETNLSNDTIYPLNKQQLEGALQQLNQSCLIQQTEQTVYIKIQITISNSKLEKAYIYKFVILTGIKEQKKLLLLVRQPYQGNIIMQYQLNQLSQGKNIQALPPGFEAISSNIFGTFCVQVDQIQYLSYQKTTMQKQMPKVMINSFRLNFFGQGEADKAQNNINNCNKINNYSLEDNRLHQIGQKIQYRVLTNMWLFYLYLSDMENLHIQFITNSSGQQTYQQKISLPLKPSKSLLSPQKQLSQQSMNIFYNTSQVCSIYYSNRSYKIANFTLNISAKFDMALHQQLIDLGMINFQDFLVFDGISPICSENQLNKQSNQQRYVQNGQTNQDLDAEMKPRQLGNQISKLTDSRRSKQIINIGKNTSKKLLKNPENNFSQLSHISALDSQMMKTKKNEYQYRQQQEQEHQRKNDEQDNRIMQQDIDRLIKQIQSKSYDASKYQQKQQHHEHPPFSKQRQGEMASKAQGQSIIRRNTYSDSYSCSEQIQSNWQSKVHLQETQAGSIVRCQANNIVPNSYSCSPINMPKSRPPSHSPSGRNSLKQTVSNSQSMSRVNPMPNNRSIANICQSQPMRMPSSGSHLNIKLYELSLTTLNNTNKNFSPHSSQASAFSTGGSQLQQCYTLKLYINQDQDQYFIAQGVKQGEIVNFNQTVKVKGRTFSGRDHIKFVICDDYGRIQCQGLFEMHRLYNTKQYKGQFMIAMVSPTEQSVPKNVIIPQSSPMLHSVSPVHRSLRISAQIVQPLQLIQIFMKITNVGVPCTMLRYKIPMTKETIEDRSVGTTKAMHVNIFPHSITTVASKSPSILLQFWNSDSLFGTSELSLKNIQSASPQLLSCSVQPVYLYNGIKPIKNIFDNDKVVGTCEVLLCFGQVKHMQGMLLGAIAQQKQKQIKQQFQKVPATFNQKLGIFIVNDNNKKSEIKQKEIQKQVNEISIQVEMGETNMSNSVGKFNEPQFGDHSIISHTSNNQFMDMEMQASLISFARNQLVQSSQKNKNQTQAAKQPSLRVGMKSLSQFISMQLLGLVAPFPPLLPGLKQQFKPYLLYNFIQVSKMKQIFLRNGLSHKQIQMLFKLVIFQKEGMVNVNQFYDIVISVEVWGTVKEQLISAQMLIVNTLRLLYKPYVSASSNSFLTILLSSQTDFNQFCKMLETYKIKPTLYEFQMLVPFLSRYKTQKQAQQLRDGIIKQLAEELQQDIRHGMKQQDILDTIYGPYQNQSSLSCSQSSAINNSATFENRLNTNQVKANRKDKMMQINMADLLQIVSQPIQNGRRNNKNEVNKLGKVKPQDKKQANNSSELLVDTKKQQRIAPIFSKQADARLPEKTISIVKFKEKSLTHTVLIEGVDNVLQSAECIYDCNFSQLNEQKWSLVLQLQILSPTKYVLQVPIGHQTKMQQIQIPVQSDNFSDVDGAVHLVLKNSNSIATQRSGKCFQQIWSQAKDRNGILASACFSLIQEVKSLYALKTVEGQFCGLLHLTLL